MATAVLFSDVYAPQLAPLGYVPADTLDRTGSLLPQGGVSRTSLFNDVYAPKLGSMSRLSAFGLTSNETIVLGTGTATAVTTQSWYIG